MSPVRWRRGQSPGPAHPRLVPQPQPLSSSLEDRRPLADPRDPLSLESVAPSRSLTPQRVVRILEAIQEINAEGSLDGQLALIAKTTTELAGCERSSVFLVDAEKHELWSKVAIGLTDQEIRMPLWWKRL